MKTPKPIVDKLRVVLKEVVESKTFADRIEKLGSEVGSLNREEMLKFLNVDAVKIAELYAEIVKKAAK